MGRTGPDTALLAQSIEASNELPIGSVIEMASSTPVVDDKYILAEGGMYSTTAWPALAQALPSGGALNASVPIGKAVPFTTIIAVRVCNDIFAMLTGSGIYTSSDGLTWTLRRSVDANYVYTLERTGDGGLVLFGSDGKVFASSNAVDWTLLASLPNKTIKYMDRIGGTYYLSDGTAVVQKTTDFVTFTTAFTAGANVTGLYCTTEVCVYCATTYYISSGGVASWSSATVGVASIHISRKSNGDIVRSVNATGAILLSSNGGMTWSTFNPINTGSSAPAFDYTNVGGIGNVAVKSGGANTFKCACFNNTPTDPTSVYIEFYLYPGSANHFLGSLYNRVEATSTEILFYKCNSTYGSAFRTINKPTTSFSPDNGARLLPFVFSKIFPSYSYLSTGISTEKIGDANYLHTCIAFAGAMYNGASPTYYAMPFAFTENAATGVYVLYDYTMAYSSTSVFGTRPLKTIVDSTSITILFAWAYSNSSYIYKMQATLGSTSVPEVSSHTGLGSNSLNCDYVWIIGNCIFYEISTTGPMYRIAGWQPGVQVDSLNSKLTANRAPSLWEDGTISYVFTNSTSTYDLYVSKDNGASFSLLLSGSQSTYAPMAYAVIKFNGYYWMLGTGGLYRGRNLNTTAVLATSTLFGGNSQISGAQSMTVSANGQFLMCMSANNVYLIDKYDNIFTISSSITSPHVPSVFFNDKSVMPASASSQTGAASMAAAGDSTPVGFATLPYLEPSAVGMHKYIKGA